jgi:single-strand DNA-binding protein
MLNRVTLIGNVGRDPEVRNFEGGGKVCKFSLATNESYRDKNNEWQTNTEWHDIVCWSGLADRAEKYVRKGNLLYIEGKIEKRKWQDKDGNDRYSTEIRCLSMKSLDRRESGSSGGYSDDFPSVEDQFPTTETSPKSNAAPEDDLPF